MLLSDQKPIELLNNLIIINNERMDGCNYAAQETDAVVLKVLFTRLFETSTVCKHELINEVYKLGGEPADGLMGCAELHQAWEEVKNAIAAKNHLKLLKSCEKEEATVIRSYQLVLQVEDEHLTSQHQQLFHRHHKLFNEDHTKVKNLLDVLLKAN